VIYGTRHLSQISASDCTNRRASVRRIAIAGV
jgi:hypothetical protein